MGARSNKMSSENKVVKALSDLKTVLGKYSKIKDNNDLNLIEIMSGSKLFRSLWQLDKDDQIRIR